MFCYECVGNLNEIDYLLGVHLNRTYHLKHCVQIIGKAFVLWVH